MNEQLRVLRGSKSVERVPRARRLERHAVGEVEPERRFVFTWDGDRVEIELEEIPAGTRVIVVESPVAEWSSALELRACALVAA